MCYQQRSALLSQLYGIESVSGWAGWNPTLRINISRTEIRTVLYLIHVLYTVVNEPDASVFRLEEMKNYIHIPFCPNK
jgi:coproporphyrinogen III oxidase-like Fe-S oxidoreductase